MDRTPRALGAAAVVLALLLGPASGGHVHAQARIYVNTTEDLPPDDSHCLPGKVCTLRAAVEKAESFSGGAVITACYDKALVPNAAPCRGPGAKPLTAEDPGYEPETNKWVLRLRPSSLPFDLTENGTTIDFRLGVEPWSGPGDAHFVVEASGGSHQFAFKIESHDNQIAGVEIRGEFAESAILLQDDFFGTGAVNNTIGPGNILAGISSGNGIKIKDPASQGNHVIGNWCGITGDGSEIAPVAEDCVFLLDDTAQNTIGGPSNADRNVFAFSRVGVGVNIQGAGTRNNTVEGNWFGVDATGQQAGDLRTGVLITEGAFRTRVVGNLVAGAANAGIAVFDAAGETTIERNQVGLAADGTTCLGNGAHGIALQHGPHDSVVKGNTVRCNNAGGILLTGASSRNNRLTENSISANNGHGIDIVQGANGNLSPPSITGHDATYIAGATCAGCIVEIFSDPNGQADHFEGRVTADATSGTWRFAPSGAFRHRTLTTTTTDGKSTSELSLFVVHSGATPTPGRPTATPDPSTTGVPLFVGKAYLPWGGQAAWLAP